MAQPAALSYSPAGSPNHFEISPLAFAAWRGDGACVAALLELPEARRELHLRDKEGWSVLHFAVRGGSPVCIRLLAQAGADVRAAVPGGQQAIHWAAAAASADCCAELLLAGALPTAPDSTGRTAVQLAQRRLQHEQAAEEQAPFQRQVGALPEARKVLALLQAAAGGQLPLGGGTGLAAASLPPAASSEGAPDTPHIGSRAASCATLDDTASIARSSAAGARSDSGQASGSSDEIARDLPDAAGSEAGQPAAASLHRCSGGSSTRASQARRECRVCLQEGQELFALIPCGHRVACAECCARLLLPGIMTRLAASAEGAAAPDGAAGAGGEACRCPVCRAEVTGSLRVYDC